MNLPVPVRRLVAATVITGALAGPACLAGPVAAAGARPVKAERTHQSHHHAQHKPLAHASGRKVG